MYTVPCSVLHPNAEELSSNEAHIITGYFFLFHACLSLWNSNKLIPMSVEEILRNDKNLI